MHPAVAGLGDQCLDERAPEPTPPRASGHRNRLDIALQCPARCEESGVSVDLIEKYRVLGGRRSLGHQVVGLRVRELVTHPVDRPGVAPENGAFEGHNRLEIGDGCPAQLPPHQLTRFGPAAIVTSGDRR